MAAEWVPAATAAISAIAALGGQAIAGLLQRRNQERAEATQRRQQAAEVVAGVRVFLTDLNPEGLGLNASEDRSPETFKKLGEQRERIRTPLLTLASGHPSTKVRDLARDLEVELADTLQMSEWFVANLLRTRDTEPARSEAIAHRKRALALLDELLDAIHNPDTVPHPLGRLSQRRQLPARR
jgi:hypothetical protein